MGDHTYVSITKALFKKYFDGYERHVFIGQHELSKKFKKTVEDIAKQNGELFLSEATIITEELSSLAEREVKRVARRHGYEARCERGRKELRYLYSEGYGQHYSSDYYELLIYSEIQVTLLGQKHTS